MDWHPIQGGVEIFLVASCHGNRDKLRPDGPLGSYADFTFLLSDCALSNYNCLIRKDGIADKVQVRYLRVNFTR